MQNTIDERSAEARRNQFAIRAARRTAIFNNVCSYFIDEHGKIKYFGDTKSKGYLARDWEDLVSIASGGGEFLLGLKADGTVYYTFQTPCRYDIDRWNSDIIMICASSTHTAVLKRNGTVMAAGSNDNGECSVRRWTDIISIKAGRNYTMGLKSDGTVVSTFRLHQTQNWKDIVDISMCSGGIAGLKSDGTVVTTDSVYSNSSAEISKWTDIVEIAGNDWYFAGLKSDGTVVAIGSDKKCLNGSNIESQVFSCDWRNVSRWKNIAHIYEYGNHLFAVDKSGNILFSREDVIEYTGYEEELKRTISSLTKAVTFEEQFDIDAKNAEQWELDRLRAKELLLKRKNDGVCTQCGGKFVGFFKKKCSECGMLKDY